jgi:hypothetical protein
MSKSPGNGTPAKHTGRPKNNSSPGEELRGY